MNLLTINIGSCGTRIGDSIYELLCQDHGVDYCGKGNDQGNVGLRSVMFCEGENGHFFPRSLFISLEESNTSKIRSGVRKNLFSPINFIGNQNASSITFAKGRKTQFFGQTVEGIRKMMENCDEGCDILLNFSTGGGTGSGFTSSLLEHFSDEYSKKEVISFPIFPDFSLNEYIVEPYNTVLCNRFIHKYSGLIFFIENAAIRAWMRMGLGIPMTYRRHNFLGWFKNYNEVISQIITSSTSSFRFPIQLNRNISEMKSNLLMLEDMNYLATSVFPLSSVYSYNSYRSNTRKFDIVESTTNTFDVPNLSVRSSPQYGKFVSSCVLYRGEVGDIDTSKIPLALQNVLSLRSVLFARWTSFSIKTGCLLKKPVFRKDTNRDRIIQESDFTVTNIFNNTFIRHSLDAILHRCSLMLKKKAFVFWYQRDGLEEDELWNAYHEFSSLSDYYDDLNSEYRSEAMDSDKENI